MDWMKKMRKIQRIMGPNGVVIGGRGFEIWGDLCFCPSFG
jgi:hypothetical protein